MPAKKPKHWIATMSEQGRITVPKAVRTKSRDATYWIIRPKKNGFEAMPLKD